MKLKNARLKLDVLIPFKYYMQRGEAGTWSPDGYHLSVIFQKEKMELEDVTNGFRLPCDTLELRHIPTKSKIYFDTLSILDDETVQVNLYKEGGYSIQKYPLEELEFVGYEYDPNEDTY